MAILRGAAESAWSLVRQELRSCILHGIGKKEAVLKLNALVTSGNGHQRAAEGRSLPGALAPRSL
jgi:hypothetical protein